MPRPDYGRWLALADDFTAATGFGMSSFRNRTKKDDFENDVPELEDI